jgi:dihydroflavonol-4-reductase
MRVFLTGGTGFIGQPLTRQLLQRGWIVDALVRRPESRAAQRLKVLGANLVRGDVTDKESMRAAMQGADMVVHNAGVYEYGLSSKARQQMYAVNVTGTENVLSLAQELNIPRTVYVSSVVSFGTTDDTVPADETFTRKTGYSTYYEETKTRAHEVALRYQQSGLPLIIACPSTVVGANDHSPFGYYLRMYINRLLVPFAWSPNIVFTLVHVDDLAEGIVLAAEKGRIGETYFFAGDPIRQRDTLKLWNQQPGGFKIRFYVPPAVMKMLTSPMSILMRLVGMPGFLSAETVDSIVHMNYSSQKAQQQLGWQHRNAQETWAQIFSEEYALRAQRPWWNLLARLKPLD